MFRSERERCQICFAWDYFVAAFGSYVLKEKRRKTKKRVKSISKTHYAGQMYLASFHVKRDTENRISAVFSISFVFAMLRKGL